MAIFVPSGTLGRLASGGRSREQREAPIRSTQQGRDALGFAAALGARTRNTLDRAALGAAIAGSQPRSNATYDAFRGALEASAPQGEWSYGRYRDEDGKPGNYAGFRTRGDLEDAVMGRAYQLQAERDMAADTIARESSLALARAGLERKGQQRLLDVEADQALRNAGYGGTQTNSTDAAYAARLGPQQREQLGITDYAKQLAEWERGERNRIGEVQEGGEMIRSLPFWEIAQIAAAENGIDPDLARGWFDESLDAKVFGRQRDAQSIATTGLPYREAMSAEEQQSAELESQAETMFDNDMYGRFGVSGRELAAAADLSPEQVLAVVDDPSFADLQSTVETALDSGDWSTIETMRNDLRTGKSGFDPALARLIEAIYQDRLDPETYGL